MFTFRYPAGKASKHPSGYEKYMRAEYIKIEQFFAAEPFVMNEAKATRNMQRLHSNAQVFGNFMNLCGKRFDKIEKKPAVAATHEQKFTTKRQNIATDTEAFENPSELTALDFAHHAGMVLADGGHDVQFLNRVSSVLVESSIDAYEELKRGYNRYFLQNISNLKNLATMRKTVNYLTDEHLEISKSTYISGAGLSATGSGSKTGGDTLDHDLTKGSSNDDCGYYGDIYGNTPIIATNSDSECGADYHYDTESSLGENYDAESEGKVGESESESELEDSGSDSEVEFDAPVIGEGEEEGLVVFDSEDSSDGEDGADSEEGEDSDSETGITFASDSEDGIEFSGSDYEDDGDDEDNDDEDDEEPVTSPPFSPASLKSINSWDKNYNIEASSPPLTPRTQRVKFASEPVWTHYEVLPPAAVEGPEQTMMERFLEIESLREKVETRYNLAPSVGSGGRTPWKHLLGLMEYEDLVVEMGVEGAVEGGEKVRFLFESVAVKSALKVRTNGG